MIRVLFLCTGNSARSILAEALANHDHGQVVEAHSAGSQPVGQVQPGALRVLAANGVAGSGFSSKSWDAFAPDGATPIGFDWVITLCDSAAGETCPAYLGNAQRAHWGLPDPARGDITFEAAFETIRARLAEFAANIGQASGS